MTSAILRLRRFLGPLTFGAAGLLALDVAAASGLLTIDARAAASFAVEPPAPAIAMPVVPAPLSLAPTRKLESALDAVRADNIRADIFFIASDELGGRDTPSDGLKIAARYIRSRLQRLGWLPGAQGGFFFTYKLKQTRVDESASHVTWAVDGKSVTLHFGRDYVFRSRSDIDDLETSAQVVFCGDGTEEAFARAKPKDRWALCFDAGDKSRKELGSELNNMSKRAKSAGAVGVIVAPGASSASDTWLERFAEETDLQRDGTVVYPRPRDKPREIYPLMCWTRSAAERLLAHAPSAAHGGQLAIGSEIPVAVSESRKLPGESGSIDLEDVCGFWPGNDPELSKEVIIVSAHYDHLGTIHGVVYNGADDNGSGTCGLMAIAESLAQYGPMRRSVMLIWVSGEEKGLFGSKAWTEHPWLPEGDRAVCDINIDMIGRNAPDKLLITPSKNHDKYNGLTRLAESVCALEGFPSLGSADDYYRRSDHFNFASIGIPAVFLFSDVHADYHQPTDKPEKIDNDKIRRVARMVLRMLDGLQTDHLNL